ncbi:FAD/NAD(P)-binding oxidoreductase [Sphaerisporangium melleum]|uniref:FAD/NAD(P)-binding oxidoreductase n=1 Tax=Sphaerisporangium melleum TaxID=321316 RepID=A0A917VT98_9ACTN|nr:FAD-dependent oxidoreductase [Sphaerisporangium melleum]GGL16328.1 FAD/NAD(P)-binding oxidoreductase [Sphaerisporangium melleum]GII70584.1 FAD/NAD(P)-binding oxidoreductase [Sphaerisporangium melleum]
MRLVVVGNGMAGARLADEVRARDKNIEITVFGAETRRPYNRVLLSNVLAGTASPEQVRLPAQLEGVTTRLGVAVTAIDRGERVVRTADGAEQPYDTLVLATGSEPVVPPVPGAGRAIAFRTMDDCHRILEAAATATGAVVVGGGLLGVEAARGLAGRGMPVTLLHLAGHLMERQLDAEAGLVLGEALAGLGVRVRTGVQVTAIREDGVELATGEVLPGELVVLACGVRPMVSLARDAGLEVGRGVVVDDHMRTSDPAIYAIGECAQHDGTVYGLVAPAWEQAAVVADLITGADRAARYRGSRLVTRLKARSVELAAMGETHLSDDAGAVEVVRFTHRARGIYRKLVIRDDRLVGAILLGDAPTVGTLTQLYDRGGPLPGDPAGLLFPSLEHATPADTPVFMPDSARVCECNNVTKGRIRACWEAGARDMAAVAAATRATTGCGSCRSAVAGIIGWLCEQEEEVRA